MAINEHMNTLKYTYVEVGPPNVVLAWPISADNPPPTTVPQNPYMEVLLTRLATRHPNWRIVYTQPQGSVQVYDGVGRSAPLGRIHLDRLYTGSQPWRYGLNSLRLDRERQRGDATYTADASKAVRLIEKNFVPKSVHEIVNEGRSTLENLASNVRHIAHRALEAAYEELNKPMRKFLRENVDLLVGGNYPYLPAHTLNKLDGLVKEDTETSSMQQVFISDHKGTVVFQHNTTYLVSQDGGAAEVRQPEELPDRVRTGIGMLKLVSDGGYISGVGVRAKEGMFYIMPEVNNEEVT